MGSDKVVDSRQYVRVVLIRALDPHVELCRKMLKEIYRLIIIHVSTCRETVGFLLPLVPKVQRNVVYSGSRRCQET